MCLPAVLHPFLSEPLCFWWLIVGRHLNRVCIKDCVLQADSCAFWILQLKSSLLAMSSSMLHLYVRTQQVVDEPNTRLQRTDLAAESVVVNSPADIEEVWYFPVLVNVLTQCSSACWRVLNLCETVCLCYIWFLDIVSQQWRQCVARAARAEKEKTKIEQVVWNFCVLWLVFGDIVFLQLFSFYLKVRWHVRCDFKKPVVYYIQELIWCRHRSVQSLPRYESMFIVV